MHRVPKSLGIGGKRLGTTSLSLVVYRRARQRKKMLVGMPLTLTVPHSQVAGSAVSHITWLVLTMKHVRNEDVDGTGPALLSDPRKNVSCDLASDI